MTNDLFSLAVVFDVVSFFFPFFTCLHSRCVEMHKIERSTLTNDMHVTNEHRTC